MKTKVEKTSTLKDEKGFTLVELAVVMIIIGLLIGGVMKGQELIINAQIASTVGQIKGVEAAVSTFKDSYRAIPGDMLRAQQRIPSCGVAPCLNGDGDSHLENAPEALPAIATEEFRFWAHLAAADMLTAVNGTENLFFGEGLPVADVGGGMTVGYSNDGDVADFDGLAGAADLRGGHYLVIRARPNAAMAAVDGHLTTQIAGRIDRKMDDGGANTGTVRAAGGNGDADGDCVTADTPIGAYREQANDVACQLYIRFGM